MGLLQVLGFVLYVASIASASSLGKTSPSNVCLTLTGHYVNTMWHEIFAGSNVCNFCGGFHDPQKKFPQKIIPWKKNSAKFIPILEIVNITFKTKLRSYLYRSPSYRYEQIFLLRIAQISFQIAKMRSQNNWQSAK